MDQSQSAPSGTRRNEDIALDLFKFVATTTGAGRATAPSTGFTATPAPKPEDHVDHLLELYARCLKTVSGSAVSGGSTPASGVSGNDVSGNGQ
jgi:hypothetical protein